MSYKLVGIQDKFGRIVSFGGWKSRLGLTCQTEVVSQGLKVGLNYDGSKQVSFGADVVKTKTSVQDRGLSDFW